MKTSKKLIEVALPLEAINTASARENSIRHGHPSTLHLWWARRPLRRPRFSPGEDGPVTLGPLTLGSASTSIWPGRHEGRAVQYWLPF